MLQQLVAMAPRLKRSITFASATVNVKFCKLLNTNTVSLIIQSTQCVGIFLYTFILDNGG